MHTSTYTHTHIHPKHIYAHQNEIAKHFDWLRASVFYTIFLSIKQQEPAFGTKKNENIYIAWKNEHRKVKMVSKSCTHVNISTYIATLKRKRRKNEWENLLSANNFWNFIAVTVISLFSLFVRIRIIFFGQTVIWYGTGKMIVENDERIYQFNAIKCRRVFTWTAQTTQNIQTMVCNEEERPNTEQWIQCVGIVCMHYVFNNILQFGYFTWARARLQFYRTIYTRFFR